MAYFKTMKFQIINKTTIFNEQQINSKVEYEESKETPKFAQYKTKKFWNFDGKWLSKIIN